MAKEAPSEPPASPDAGGMYILSNRFNLSTLPLATQLRATPPAKHKLLEFVNLYVSFTILITISAVTFCIASDILQ